MTTAAKRFNASSLSARVASFGLSALVTAVALAGLGGIADGQVDRAQNDIVLAQSTSAPATGHAVPGVAHRRASKA